MNTIEKAAVLICSTDYDPCCKGGGCTHGKALYRDSVRAILTAWTKEPPEVMVDKAFETVFKQYPTLDWPLISKALRAAFQAALDEK